MTEQTEQTESRSAWLRAAGLDATAAIALPADASPRRYFRLPGTGMLLVQVPPNDVEQPVFTQVADHLNRIGLSAPRTHRADPNAGFYLVEDFGTLTYSAELKNGVAEATLYATAVDVIAALHNAPDATDITLPPYDAAFLLAEVQIFADWFAPYLRPGLDQEHFLTTFLSLWSNALRPVADLRTALVLRDFHLDNLIHLPDRQGVQRCGLIDVQGARIGAPEYDLASLLQDARRDLEPGLEAAMIARYLGARGGADPAFSKRYHLLAAQRHTKVAGLFIRLWQRDSKAHYLVHMPRVLGHLSQALEAADLTQIRDLMDTHLGDWRGCAP